MQISCRNGSGCMPRSYLKVLYRIILCLYSPAFGLRTFFRKPPKCFETEAASEAIDDFFHLLAEAVAGHDGSNGQNFITSFGQYESLIK